MKVFVLYCKDQEEYSCKDVEQLSDVLISCGGIKCIADYYEEQRPPNWNTWTLKKIKECDYVIMVCSPKLETLLSSNKHYDIQMRVGFFSSDAVVNLIDARKFVPVFLNNVPSGQECSWLPDKLLSSSQFHLQYLNAFYSSVYGVPDSCQEEHNRSVYKNLRNPKFQGVASLVQHLRKEPAVVKPKGPSHPIPITPQASQAFPLDKEHPHEFCQGRA